MFAVKGIEAGSSSASRANRSLAVLNRSASTARVLNLVAVEAQHGGSAEHREAPLFRSPIFNTAFLLKHRLRSDEAYLFRDGRQSATKLIIPFSTSDLGLGGRSLLISQPGWREMIRSLSTTAHTVDHDLQVMALIDELPSLDPFLLKEKLRRHGYEVAPCYFAISGADIERMRAFVISHLSRLIKLALGQDGASIAVGVQTARLADALLSTDIDERLSPLQSTLQLEGDAFREGLFSWKGFLYYKWMEATLRADLDLVFSELAQLKLCGAGDVEQVRYVDAASRRLVAAMKKEQRSVRAALQVYDDAYRDLTENANPQAFRAFLLSAPSMFMRLGETLGAISHFASFWRYRFSGDAKLEMSFDEAMDFYQDYEQGLCVQVAA